MYFNTSSMWSRDVSARLFNAQNTKQSRTERLFHFTAHYFTERNATEIAILYVQFITLSATFHLGLDLAKCLFLSGFPSEILCVFLISAVHFSCPICPSVFQLTTHHHSLTSTNHAAPHCSTPRYSLCHQTKYLPQPLF